MKGDPSQATIINVDDYRGVKGRRGYTYTLTAAVNNVSFTDSYNASSTSDGSVGDTIDVYVSTSEASPEIAIARVVRNTPINAGIPFLVIGGLLGWYFFKEKSYNEKI